MRLYNENRKVWRHIKRLIIGLIIILFIGGTLYIVNKKENVKDDEAPLAAGINLDPENVQPILSKVSSVLDSGFSIIEIKIIRSKIDKMKNNEIKEIGKYNVIYQGQKAVIRIEAEMSIEDDEREVYLYLYSNHKLVKVINNEMMKFADEKGM